MSKNSRKQNYEAFKEWYERYYDKFIKKHKTKKQQTL